jgi:hypothetical protein
LFCVIIQVLRLNRTQETAVTDCTLSKIEFPRCRGRRVAVDFGGGDISSNGGALLVGAADRRLGLLSGLARRRDDRRQAGTVATGGKGKPKTRGRADKAAAVVFPASGPLLVGGERCFQAIMSHGS